MKDAARTTIDDAVAGLARYDAILDARSPAEYLLDHVPGAISTPVLDDVERVTIGTMYKERGAFDAKRQGAAIVARRIAGLLEGPLAAIARDARLLVYCWRGGNRSGALATVLARVGWRTAILEGGYRAFRRFVLDDLERLPGGFRFAVVTGRTGSGKSLLLERAQALGAQVLDLEALARHRGSVLGHLPQNPQPSQKHFETLVWDQLRSFDSSRPVLVESESRKVGQCQLPPRLIEAMRASVCVRVEANDTVRARLLLAEYPHFVEDPGLLARRIAALAGQHGQATLARWLALAQPGSWEQFVGTLLSEHYDPAYDRSMQRNYAGLAQAQSIVLEDCDGDALDTAARALVRLADPGALASR
ncbi:MAG: tRNA 2-selenouridine(34) synthase MnmH [Burkholderiaceae bacterium]|nr:tRNA 2-selenouridine(34) synthase MnmH [Burkholderiaceae bacterium]